LELLFVIIVGERERRAAARLLGFSGVCCFLRKELVGMRYRGSWGRPRCCEEDAPLLGCELRRDIAGPLLRESASTSKKSAKRATQIRVVGIKIVDNAQGRFLRMR
jgi:hypothetical protein